MSDDLFILDRDTGVLFWKAPPKNHTDLLFQVAGSLGGTEIKRYWVVQVNGKKLKRSHVVFYMTHGRFPRQCIDHINGNSLDDRPENLREATVTQNAWNHKSRKRKANLPMGVRLINKSGRYQARISFHGKQIHLGAFDTKEEARQVYIGKRKELYGEFA